MFVVIDFVVCCLFYLGFAVVDNCVVIIVAFCVFCCLLGYCGFGF